MRIGVLGVGSLGTIIGALIAERGFDVDLIDTNHEHIQALNEHGAKITGFLEKTIPVKAVHPEQLEGQYDVIFLLTKQIYTESAIDSIKPHLNSESIVCTLQNGIPEENVANLVGTDRTIGGVVGFGATWRGPGCSELTTEWETVRRYAFDIGEINGEETERLAVVKDILESVGTCVVDSNIMGMKWTKLLMNATFSGMSAALGCTFGDVLDDSEAMKYLGFIADETISVARAHGVRLVPMQGDNLEALKLQPGETVEDKMHIYNKVWNPHRNLKASMLQDLEKGIRTEIHHINGVVCTKGREYGIPTLYNDLVVKLVSEAESNKEVPSFEKNLLKFRSVSSVVI